jgi:tRNA(fMet)-specific endonuclease VapC
VNGYLLDTNVLSETIRKRPDEAVVARLRGVPQAQCFTSVVCVMELHVGAKRHRQSHALWQRIERDVLARVRVVPFGHRACLRAGGVLAELEVAGTPVGVEDVMIGATALELDLTVVTRNVRHFDRITGLRVENWWK